VRRKGVERAAERAGVEQAMSGKAVREEGKEGEAQAGPPSRPKLGRGKRKARPVPGLG